MSVKVEQTSPLDLFKWLVAVGFLLAAGVGYYYYSDWPFAYRVIGLLLACIFSAFIALSTQKGKVFWRFAKESRQEVKQVVWPTRQESLQTTAIVIVAVVIVAIFLWLVDLTLAKVIAWLLG